MKVLFLEASTYVWNTIACVAVNRIQVGANTQLFKARNSRRGLYVQYKQITISFRYKPI